MTKADTQNEWYNYEDKIWANAVILEDESVIYNNGDTIPENNIESYFVWIPRYRYKIWDEGKYEGLTTIDESKVHTIQVEFETKEVEASNGSTENSWLTHPAFTSFGVNELWVGKFESGYKGATNQASSQLNTNESEKLQIKPNVYSWRNIQVANAHLTSYNYKRNLDSHMMKNTEWGSVAYLQHSAYGSQQSVRINNNSDRLTGYASLYEPTVGYIEKNVSCIDYPEACNGYGTTEDITKLYNTETGYLASTTGNISGVYDMSGGSFEFMMSVLLDVNNNLISGIHNNSNSGFVGIFSCSTCTGGDSTILENTEGIEWPDEKYYDVYKYQTIPTIYTNGILGDATGELGPFQIKLYDGRNRTVSSWYNDLGAFIYNKNPWVVRGGGFSHGSDSGIFNFDYDVGVNYNWDTFRVVLAI